MALHVSKSQLLVVSTGRSRSGYQVHDMSSKPDTVAELIPMQVGGEPRISITGDQHFLRFGHQHGIHKAKRHNKIT